MHVILKQYLIYKHQEDLHNSLLHIKGAFFYIIHVILKQYLIYKHQ